MINTDPERSPGRPPKVTFPIRRTVVIHGNDREMVIQENQTVTCLRCSKPFLVNSDTAVIRKSCLDLNEYVRCPNCGFIADAFYYLTDPPLPKVRNQKQDIPWQKPEA